MKKVITSCIIALSIGTTIGLVIYKLFHRENVESLNTDQRSAESADL